MATLLIACSLATSAPSPVTTSPIETSRVQAAHVTEDVLGTSHVRELQSSEDVLGDTLGRLNQLAQDGHSRVQSHFNEHGDEYKAQASSAWDWVKGTSNTVTTEAVNALDSSFSATSKWVMWVLDISEEAFKNALTIAANLGFCALMLWGYLTLPPDLMVAMGFLTFFIGPALIVFGLGVVGSILYFMAWAPMLFVFILFVAALLRSQGMYALGQRWLLIDDGNNKEGVVDWRTLIAFSMIRSTWWENLKTCANRVTCGWLKMHDFVELELAISAPPKQQLTAELLRATLDEFEERMERRLRRMEEQLMKTSRGGSGAAQAADANPGDSEQWIKTADGSWTVVAGSVDA